MTRLLLRVEFDAGPHTRVASSGQGNLTIALFSVQNYMAETGEGSATEPRPSGSGSDGRGRRNKSFQWESGELPSDSHRRIFLSAQGRSDPLPDGLGSVALRVVFGGSTME